MGVSHSLDREQVEAVLGEFEATTTSIRGIESKMKRVEQYMKSLQEQKTNWTQYADMSSKLLDGLGESIGGHSVQMLDYFDAAFEHFLGLVEAIETSLYGMGIREAPKQIQREFGPLLVPAVVLVMIVTASNCYFGFLLASDEELTDSLQGLPVQNAAQEAAQETNKSLHILTLFAVGHVVLIGAAFVYLVSDLIRQRMMRIRMLIRSFCSFVSTSSATDSRSNAAGPETLAATFGRLGSESGLGDESPPDSPAVPDGGSPTSGLPFTRRAATEPWMTSRRDNNQTSPPRMPVSQLLRRFQKASSQEGIRSPKLVNMISNTFAGEAILRRKRASLLQDFLGKQVVLQKTAVHVAAVARSKRIGYLKVGEEVNVLQAIRCGRQKIWGRLEEPQGWVLLSDPTAERCFKPQETLSPSKHDDLIEDTPTKESLTSLDEYDDTGSSLLEL